MAEVPPNRVFLPDVRGGDLYLRATWHPDSATVVFSHWNGGVCVASTPVALTESTSVIDLLVRALSEVADRQLLPGEPPAPQTTFERLRLRLQPKLADVIDARTRFRSKGHRPREATSPRR